MAYYSVVRAPHVGVFEKSSVQPAAPAKRGVLRRFLDAVMESRQRQADREIGRFLHDRGSKFTDEVEREIERRFLSNPSTRW